MKYLVLTASIILIPEIAMKEIIVFSVFHLLTGEQAFLPALQLASSVSSRDNIENVPTVIYG